jgi:hypothetical protein
VRTQVDHDLTTVSRVDRRLRLIKNLGRHSAGTSSAAGLQRRGGAGEPHTIDSPMETFIFTLITAFYFQCCNCCSDMLQSVSANVA